MRETSRRRRKRRRERRRWEGREELEEVGGGKEGERGKTERNGRRKGGREVEKK